MGCGLWGSVSLGDQYRHSFWHCLCKLQLLFQVLSHAVLTLVFLNLHTCYSSALIISINFYSSLFSLAGTYVPLGQTEISHSPKSLCCLPQVWIRCPSYVVPLLCPTCNNCLSSLTHEALQGPWSWCILFSPISLLPRMVLGI